VCRDGGALGLGFCPWPPVIADPIRASFYPTALAVGFGALRRLFEMSAQLS
jgi:hypothetical protein